MEGIVLLIWYYFIDLESMVLNSYFFENMELF